MKQYRYRAASVKGILVAAEHILAAVVAVSLLWILVYPAAGAELFSGKPGGKYEDTAYFRNQVLNAEYSVLSKVAASKVVETEGVYNPDKLVDVEQYADTGTIDGKNTSGLAYRLEDLYKMGERWARSGEDTAENNIMVCKKPDGTYHYYSYNEFEDLIASGEYQFVLSVTGEYDNEDILNMFGNNQVFEGGSETIGFRGLQDLEGKVVYIDCWNFDGTNVNEVCTPEGAESIMEIANNTTEWNGRLNEAYEMVRHSAYGIYETVESYRQQGEDSYQEGDSNLAYIYVDMANKRVYTNREAYRDYADLEESLEQIRAMGKYAVIMPKLKDFDTNISNIDEAIWRDEIKNQGDLDGENFVYAVGVDTSYPIHDAFYSENQMYEKYGGTAGTMAMIGMVAALLFAAILIWLSIVAGRSSRDDVLHLNRFDYIKTELAAVIVVGLWAVPVMMAVDGSFLAPVCQVVQGVGYGDGSEAYDYVKSAVPSIIIWTGIAVYTCGMFLIGYLSLLRRIKAHELWKNSIVRSVCRFVKYLFGNLHIVWKTVILFAGFALIHWIAMLSFGGNGVIILLMIAVEIAAFIYLIYQAVGKQKIKKGIEKIAGGEVDYQIPTNSLRDVEQRIIAEKINSIGEGLDAALEENMKSERLKTDLITNVSHDIKTPLTSIINYVELLKQENFEDPKIQRYIEVLEQKAQRLKTLTEDVVEASKVSSGNINLEYMNINLVEMIQQTSGEFEEKFSKRDLREVLTLPEEEVVIRVDGRRMWRVLENIYNNAAKYAMQGSRIYADLKVQNTEAVFTLKNVSEQPLNISADELTERFIRGDISRSTEGSGLGLSIAKTLTEMQGGKFEIYVDGDLFRVTITFGICG